MTYTPDQNILETSKNDWTVQASILSVSAHPHIFVTVLFHVLFIFFFFFYNVPNLTSLITYINLYPRCHHLVCFPKKLPKTGFANVKMMIHTWAAFPPQAQLSKHCLTISNNLCTISNNLCTRRIWHNNLQPEEEWKRNGYIYFFSLSIDF